METGASSQESGRSKDEAAPESPALKGKKGSSRGKDSRTGSRKEKTAFEELPHSFLMKVFQHLKIQEKLKTETGGIHLTGSFFS